MIKTILAGLLIGGLAHMMMLKAKALESNQNNVLAIPVKTEPANFASICTLPNSWTGCRSLQYQSSVQNQSREVTSNINFPNLAKMLMSRSINLDCATRSPELVWQGQKNLLKSSFYSAKCIFPWQTNFGQKSTVTKNLAIPPQLSSQSSVSSHPRAEDILPQFPKLSRSSLIVSAPQRNESSSINHPKLANPAPATKRIASPFGWRSRPYSNQLQFHQGIDYGAPFGSPVVAVGNGIVTKVSSGCVDFGNLFCGGQLGNWIEIDHGNGVFATYGHLKNTSIAIKTGTKVQKNQQIAQVGSSGWSTGAHLDFRLKIDGKYENPANYVVAINQN